MNLPLPCRWGLRPRHGRGTRTTSLGVILAKSQRTTGAALVAQIIDLRAHAGLTRVWEPKSTNCPWLRIMFVVFLRWIPSDQRQVRVVASFMHYLKVWRPSNAMWALTGAPKTGFICPDTSLLSNRFAASSIFQDSSVRISRALGAVPASGHCRPTIPDQASCRSQSLKHAERVRSRPLSMGWRPHVVVSTSSWGACLLFVSYRAYVTAARRRGGVAQHLMLVFGKTRIDQSIFPNVVGAQGGDCPYLANANGCYGQCWAQRLQRPVEMRG